MRSQIFSVLKLVAKFGFAFAILFYMVHTGRLDLSVVRKGFENQGMLLSAMALVVLSLVISFYRWGLLMRGQGVSFTFPQLVRYGMIGNFFNTTMPGAVSGDLIKAWYVLADHKSLRKAPVLTSVLLDRVMGVFGLVLVSASPLLLFGPLVWATPSLRAIALPVMGCFAGVLLFFTYLMLSGWGPLALLRNKAEILNGTRAGASLLQLYDAWVSYRRQPRILAGALILSMLNFFCQVVITILCAHAIGEDSLSTYQYFLLVPVGLLATAVPIAPAGLGVGHAAFRALFMLVGSPRGSEIFTMFAAVQISFNLLGVFFYLASSRVNEDPLTELRAEPPASTRTV